MRPRQPSKRFLVFVALFLITLVTLSCKNKIKPAPSRTEQPDSAPAPEMDTSIRKIDFRNFEYVFEYESGELKIQLQNGKWTEVNPPSPGESVANEREYEFNKVNYADFTGAGREQAAVTLDGSVPGMNLKGKDLFVFDMQGGAPVMIGHIEADDIKVIPDKKTIITFTPLYKRGDPLDVWTTTRAAVYQWNGTAFGKTEVDLVPTGKLGRYAPAIEAPKLPELFVDEGACPFECCEFGEWKAKVEYSIHKDPDPASETVGTITKEEKFKALTGRAFVTPGKVVITTLATDEAVISMQFDEGDEVYELTPLGEGWSKYWYYGYIGSASFNCEFDEGGDCWYKRVKTPEMIWWVKVQTQGGAQGWISEPNDVVGSDRCSGETVDSLEGGGISQPEPAQNVLDAVDNYSAFLSQIEGGEPEYALGHVIDCDVFKDGKIILDKKCELKIDSMSEKIAPNETSGFAAVYAVYKPIDCKNCEIAADGGASYFLVKTDAGWLGVAWCYGSDGPTLTREIVDEYKIPQKTLENLGWSVEEQ